MTLFPQPNIPGATTVNNYLYNGALENNIDQGDVRVDYRTDKASIFGRFSKENAATINPGFLPPPAIGAGPGYPGLTLAPGLQGVLGYGRSLGPNKYYEIRVGFSRLVENIIDADTSYGKLAEQLGMQTQALTRSRSRIKITLLRASTFRALTRTLIA